MSNDTQKKILTNVWVVRDKPPNSEPMYFAGMTTSEITHNAIARFEPLSSETKTHYKNKKAAAAAARIANECYESPYVEAFFLEYAEFEDTPKLEKEETHITAPTPPAAPAEPPPLRPVDETDADGWDIIDAVGTTKARTPYMLRKVTGDVQSYAIQTTDGGKFYLPGDELLAWERYCDERKRFICDRIRVRRISEGKDPDGMDEWR